MSKIIVSPSILSADFANLENEIKKLENNGADWIHVDVMDGHFVPNITIGAPVVKAIRKVTSIPLDVHLMIENPEKYIEDFIHAGSDIITIHYEAVKENTLNVINQIKTLGAKAGLSIKPKTQPKEIFKYLKDIDLVIIMSVEPGFGGQKFIFECAEKIPVLKKQNANIIIEADGGINKETAQLCKEYGIDVLVAGSYIFSGGDIKEAIKSLR
ncbi:MAG: ribulose-phosphate 3-epimerase [Candidatus Gastranaerophilales bacterium]|nr:ribulose-phosphate 3-epimerase [Candidatus Gastranaerophilales bacterium]